MFGVPELLNSPPICVYDEHNHLKRTLHPYPIPTNVLYNLHDALPVPVDDEILQ